MADDVLEVGSDINMVSVYRFVPFATALDIKDDQRDIRAEFVLIPGGQFTMGMDETTRESWNTFATKSEFLDESNSPTRVVSIAPFLLARVPLTQSLADATDVSPYWDQRVTHGEHLPCHGLPWTAARDYAERFGLRLPSESEWEFACRAETDTPFFFGESELVLQHYAVWRMGAMLDVGSRASNQFGLFDMLGNVAEWCVDDWHDDYKGAPNDQAGWIDPDGGPLKVARGGDWNSETVLSFLSAFRVAHGANYSGAEVGTRLAASITSDV